MKNYIYSGCLILMIWITIGCQFNAAQKEMPSLDFAEFLRENPDLSTYRKESYRNREKVYLSLRLLQGDSLLSSNIVFFVSPKHLQLKEPEIKYSVSENNGKIKIEVSASHFAAFVELGIKNNYARFSDNFFHLIPGEIKTVDVVSTGTPHNEIRGKLYVKSLIDTYSSNQDVDFHEKQ